MPSRFACSPPLSLVFALAVFFLIGGATANTNFDQCLAEVRNGTWGQVGGMNNIGQPVPVSEATAVTYELCNRACGTGPEAFSWPVFSQQFSAWLLPWLALISQLPFGARLRSENIMSMTLAIGSPVLAAYSLVLTVLNGRWLARQFASYEFPNTRYAVRILTSLQQTHLAVTTTDGLLSSLVVLPENDAWWADLAEWLDYTHTWSIAAAASIAWVLIAYLFTVIDSFTAILESVNSNGQSVGSVWLWLLPVVVGWLQISPKCDSDRLTAALKRANARAYVAPACPGAPALMAEETTAERAFAIQRLRPGSVYHDEECSAPIYNYARFFSWVQAAEEVSCAFYHASERVRQHRPVDPARGWEVKGARNGEILPQNREGSVEQVEAYCSSTEYVHRSRWGPHVLSRSIVAGLLSLALQWGTTGAAIIVVYFTPTTGMGCRSGAYLIYAIVSTLVWMMMVTSSALAHYSAPHSFKKLHPSLVDASEHSAAIVSILLRRAGKVIAAGNALWILVACMFQFSNFFDRCYCNSSVLGRGATAAYNVIQFTEQDLPGMRQAWIGGVVLALSVGFGFIGFLNTFLDPALEM
ncbi:hypothetical protein HWV62_24161 [Athelia sp. TMB]|nr:hypothetical protein HWV62_24161 [Athelia sp. TMB]